MNLDTTIKKQRDFFQSYATRPISFRIAQLKKLKNIIKLNEEAIMEALRKDLRKSAYESFLTEISFLYEEINHTCRHLKQWAAPQKKSSPWALKPSSAKIIFEPLGLVCIFAPWNYPFQLILSPLVGAMASGNCAVLKPDHQSQHTQSLVLELIQKNFPEEYICAIGGGIENSETLLKENFDFIFFTGSSRVGQIVLSAAAKKLTPVCLELGGKSPCIVDASAHLEIAAKRICWGKFLNAGQTCVAPDFLCLHESIHDAFIQALRAEIKKQFGVNPLESKFYGRIINQRHFERLQSLLSPHMNQLTAPLKGNEKYIPPTLLTDIDWDSKIMEEEIFGPILPVIRYKQEKELYAILQKKPKALAAYFFSNSREKQEEFLSKLSFGGGCLNDCVVHLGNSHLPFGGVAHSGMGAYHGQHSFELMSHKKSIHQSSTFFDNPLRYPHTSKKRWSFLKWYFK